MYMLNITLITAQTWIGRQQLAEEITQNETEERYRDEIYKREVRGGK